MIVPEMTAEKLEELRQRALAGDPVTVTDAELHRLIVDSRYWHQIPGPYIVDGEDLQPPTTQPTEPPP